MKFTYYSHFIKLTGHDLWFIKNYIYIFLILLNNDIDSSNCSINLAINACA